MGKIENLSTHEKRALEEFLSGGIPELSVGPDGPAASFDDIATSSTLISELGWKQDGNSPQFDENFTTSTYQLAGEYDQVAIMFIIDASNLGSSQLPLFQGTINGNTGANYYVTHQDGSKTNGANYMYMARNSNQGRRQFMYLISGRFTDRATITRELADGGQSNVQAADVHETGPLTSLTLTEENGYTIKSIEWNVYGRDMA